MNLTFEKFARINRERQQAWPNKVAWTGADKGNELAGETGEACNIIKKLRRIETGTSGTDPSHALQLLGMLGDELADVVICAQLVAEFYGINLEEALIDKFNATSLKVGLPQRLPAS